MRVVSMEHRPLRMSIDVGVGNCIKFLAAILIAFHHYSQYVISENPASANLFYQFCSSQGGYLGVAIFFFLSGFGVMESEQKRHLSPKEFVDKRLRRVIFPLVVLAIIWTPLYHFAQLYYQNFSPTLRGVVVTALNVGGWFVTAIIIMYMVFVIFTYTLNRYGKRESILALSIFTILAYIVCDLFLGYYTPLSIPLFSAGIIASLCRDDNIKYFNSSLLYVGTALIFTVGYCVLVKNSISLAVHGVVNYLAIILLILIFTNFTPRIVFPAILGEISFDVYLIHKKIILLYSIIYKGELINKFLWLSITLLAVALFVILRKWLWHKIFG